ncbi:unnamed protein product [Arctogadus glacialis]
MWILGGPPPADEGPKSVQGQHWGSGGDRGRAMSTPSSRCSSVRRIGLQGDPIETRKPLCQRRAIRRRTPRPGPWGRSSLHKARWAPVLGAHLGSSSSRLPRTPPKQDADGGKKAQGTRVLDPRFHSDGEHGTGPGTALSQMLHGADSPLRKGSERDAGRPVRPSAQHRCVDRETDRRLDGAVPTDRKAMKRATT